jgi:hypothetical protein
VVSHISRKTCEMWGPPKAHPQGKTLKDPPPCPAQLTTCNNTRVPHISLVFREMWNATNLHLGLSTTHLRAREIGSNSLPTKR